MGIRFFYKCRPYEISIIIGIVAPMMHGDTFFLQVSTVRNFDYQETPGQVNQEIPDTGYKRIVSFSGHCLLFLACLVAVPTQGASGYEASPVLRDRASGYEASPVLREQAMSNIEAIRFSEKRIATFVQHRSDTFFRKTYRKLCPTSKRYVFPKNVSQPLSNIEAIRFSEKRKCRVEHSVMDKMSNKNSNGAFRDGQNVEWSIP